MCLRIAVLRVPIRNALLQLADGYCRQSIAACDDEVGRPMLPCGQTTWRTCVLIGERSSCSLRKVRLVEGDVRYRWCLGVQGACLEDVGELSLPVSNPTTSHASKFASDALQFVPGSSGRARSTPRLLLPRSNSSRPDSSRGDKESRGELLLDEDDLAFFNGLSLSIDRSTSRRAELRLLEFPRAGMVSAIVIVHENLKEK